MSKAQKTTKKASATAKTAAKPAKTKTGVDKEKTDKAKAKTAAKPVKAKPAKKTATVKVAAKPAKKTATKVEKKTRKAVPAANEQVKKAEEAPARRPSSSTTAKIEKLAQTAAPAQETAQRPMVKPQGFSHAGLGVKISSKKPGLSIAPGVMILGRPAAEKTGTPERISERRLSKKELADIKTVLLEKRERLLAGMRRELAVQRERAESKAADEVDKATDAYDENLSFEIASANDQELGEIQVALEKIDKGTYGECEICGCTISPSRLKILPSATTCVSCRGQEEMARRRDDSNLLFSLMNPEEGDGESGEM